MIGIPMSKPPELLYHYCSTESFYGIITSKNIRLCNCLYSNDPNENMISKHHLESISKESKDENVRDFARKVLDYEFDLIDDNGSYIFCMSEKPDDLNQWRIYGDNGFGFMLGFRTKYFLDNNYWSLLNDKVIFPFPDKIYLCKCIYDFGIQKSIIELFIKVLITDSKDNEEDKILNLKHVMRYYSAIFKHESYSDEQEWRLICFPITQPSPTKDKIRFNSFFTAKRGLISQFIQMDYMGKSEWGNGPFDSVILGSNVANTAHEIINFTQFQGGYYVDKMMKSELKIRLK
jgi:hypothetical protein